MASGSLSAALAFQYLIKTASMQKMNERTLREERITTLQDRNRFFMPTYEQFISQYSGSTNQFHKKQ